MPSHVVPNVPFVEIFPDTSTLKLLPTVSSDPGVVVPIPTFPSARTAKSELPVDDATEKGLIPGFPCTKREPDDVASTKVRLVVLRLVAVAFVITAFVVVEFPTTRSVMLAKVAMKEETKELVEVALVVELFVAAKVVTVALVMLALVP